MFRKVGSWVLLLFLLSPMLVSASAASGDRPVEASEAIQSWQPDAGALTPLQQAFRQSINARKASGLPAPAAVSFEAEVVPESSRTSERAAGVRAFKLIYRTRVHFDSPQQAGQEKWPNLIVEDKMAAHTRGTVKAGDYTQAVRDAMEKAHPGIGKQHQAGYEPRTFTFEETYEVVGLEDNLAAPTSRLAAPAVSDQILFGFTNAFNYNYELNISEEFANTGVTVWSNVRLAYSWGAGLRLPVTVTLTSPVEAMFQESTYTLASSIASANWAGGDYSSQGVLPFDGKELVLEAHFLAHVAAGIKGAGLDITLINWEKNLDFDIEQYGVIQDFSTPFGNILYPIREYDLSPDKTEFYVPAVFYKEPIFGNVLADVDLGLGFLVKAGLGSTLIKADWRAEGNASGYGEINYSTNGGVVAVSPVIARDFGSAQDATVRLTNFRYYPNLLEFTLSGYLCASGEILGSKINCADLTTKNNPVKIYELDIELGVDPLPVHAGTSDAVVLQVPVTSPIRIVKTADKPVVPVGDTVTITTVVTNVGGSDLTNVRVTDNGVDVLECPDILGSCTYIRTLTATQQGDLASVTEVTATLIRDDQPVPVRSIATLLVPVLNGIVGSGTPASCNEAALDAELADNTVGTITFNCGGPATIVISAPKTISRNLTINGGDNITLSGDNQVRVFYVEAQATLNLQQLIVANGRAHRQSGTAILEAGGGIYNLGTVNLQHAVLLGNEADQGGGIQNKGVLNISDGSKLAGNKATLVVAGGGSVATGGAIYNDGALTIVDSTIGGNSEAEGNYADGGGGGILNWDGGTVALSANSVMANNRAGNGGGLENGGNGVISIHDTDIHHNQAVIGGGVFNYETGRLVIANSSLTSNIAAQGGGIQNKGWLGIQVDLNNALLSGTTILSGNQAVSAGTIAGLDGGAIYNDGTLNIANSTLENNSARGGGGILNWDGGTVHISGSAIVDNQAGNAGGIENGGNGLITIRDTRISDNEATSSGGGIFNYETGRIIISNSSLSDNIAAQGGGIQNKGALGIQIDLNNDSVIPGSSVISGNAATALDGGAIYNDGTLRIANSRLENNTARGGGGILNWQSPAGTPGYVDIIDSQFINNSAINGGGIQNGYDQSINVTLKIKDSYFADNKASEGGGLRNGQGGVAEVTGGAFQHNLSVSAYSGPPLNGGGVWNNGDITIAGTTFSANEADSGGGALVNTDAGEVTITNSTFVANIAGYSGAIQNGGSGRMLIQNTTLADNVADNYGGGLRNIEEGIVTIGETTFSGNSASWGGGISNESANADALTLTDCIVRDNTASGNFSSAGGGIYNFGNLSLENSAVNNNFSSGSGGGIANWQATAKLTNTTISSNNAGSFGGGLYNSSPSHLNGMGVELINSTIFGNTGSFGGGIYNFVGPVNSTNSIVAGNTAIIMGGDCSGNPISSGDYNLDSDGTCGLTQPNDLSGVDPLLKPLADNGGATPTQALPYGSPAIDHIPVDQCLVSTDQRGVSRPQGAGCDIGAFELEFDNLVGVEGGTVSDPAGSGAAFSVAPNVLTEDITVSITTIQPSRVGGFTGLETEFVDIDLTPTPSFAVGSGATIFLPLVPDATMAAGESLRLFIYDPDSQTLIDTGIDGVVQEGVAVFQNVSQFSVFVAAPDSAKVINGQLRLIDLTTRYNPDDPRAPAGVFTFIATYRNKSAKAIRDPFFKVVRLGGDHVLLNAYGGPGQREAVVPVWHVELGNNGQLDPGESFPVEFEVGLANRRWFTLVVKAFGMRTDGQAALARELPDDEIDLEFEATEAQLEVGQNRTLYLPLILK